MTVVVIPLDGSALAERALAYAIPLARRSRARLRLVRACVSVPPIVLDSGAAVRVAVAAHAADLHDAHVAMEAHAEELRKARLKVDWVVRCDPAAEVILGEVETAGANLVVMSTHGRGGLGRLVHGSVADEVLRRATVPVLLVPSSAPEAPARGRTRRVLVALDGSGLAEASLDPAVRLAQATGAALALLVVVDPPEGLGKHAFVRAERAKARRYLRRVAKRLQPSDGDVSSHVRVGPVVPTILAAAAELGAGMIAVGTHGRSGLSRLVMGSVATGLVEHAALPLLIVSPRAADHLRQAHATARRPAGRRHPRDAA